MSSDSTRANWALIGAAVVAGAGIIYYFWSTASPAVSSSLAHVPSTPRSAKLKVHPWFTRPSCCSLMVTMQDLTMMLMPRLMVMVTTVQYQVHLPTLSVLLCLTFHLSVKDQQDLLVQSCQSEKGKLQPSPAQQQVRAVTPVQRSISGYLLRPRTSQTSTLLPKLSRSTLQKVQHSIA